MVREWFKIEKNRKIILCIIGILLCATLVISFSYAYWRFTMKQANENVALSACFEVVLEEGEAINLTNAYPIHTNEVLTNKDLKPFHFKVINKKT